MLLRARDLISRYAQLCMPSIRWCTKEQSHVNINNR